MWGNGLAKHEKRGESSSSIHFVLDDYSTPLPIAVFPLETNYIEQLCREFYKSQINFASDTNSTNTQTHPTSTPTMAASKITFYIDVVSPFAYEAYYLLRVSPSLHFLTFVKT